MTARSRAQKQIAAFVLLALFAGASSACITRTVRETLVDDGYTAVILRSQEKGGEAIDEAEARRRIIASIDAGKPIMSHGIVGPPETCLITGYDGDGDILIGWSFFQNFEDCRAAVEFEPNGMFRKRNWYPAAFDLFMVGEPIDPIPRRE